MRLANPEPSRWRCECNHKNGPRFPGEIGEIEVIVIEGNPTGNGIRGLPDDGFLRRGIVHQAAQELGAPDLAIHSAGVLHNGPLVETPAADFERVIDINLKGSRHFAAAVLAHMQPGSQIAFIASLAGLTSNFGYTAYCASKFGVRGLAEALRYELKLQGIAVSLCCPGEIMTPMVAQERRAMHPVSAAMKDFAGSSTLDKSVPALLRGIARREFEITDTPKAALTAWLSRHTPGLARAVGDGIARRAQARLSKGTP